MTVSSTSSTTSTTTSTGTTATDTTSPAAQKDQFLQILLTQLQNQNPTDPMKPEEFASQLAQFSALEQQVDTNTKLDTLIAKLGSTNVSPVSYLGTTVDYSSPTAPIQGGNASWSYSADGANSITITAKDANGNVVYTGAGDTSTTGPHTLTLSAGSTAVDGATLTLSITATDSTGGAITPIISARANVTAVDTATDGSTNLEASGYSIPSTSVTRITPTVAATNNSSTDSSTSA